MPSCGFLLPKIKAQIAEQALASTDHKQSIFACSRRGAVQNSSYDFRTMPAQQDEVVLCASDKRSTAIPAERSFKGNKAALGIAGQSFSLACIFDFGRFAHTEKPDHGRQCEHGRK